MDVLLSLLAFFGLLLAYLNLKRMSLKLGVWTGFFVALSFLTRSIMLGQIVFIFLVALFYFGLKKRWSDFARYFLPIFASFALFSFLLFPALWSRPAHYLTEIINEGRRVGIRKGHDHIYFGQETNDPGMFFYPLVILLKSSPLLIIGVVVLALSCLSRKAINKEKLRNLAGEFVNFSTVFYLGYFLAMIYPAKKLDRYMLFIFPYLTLISVEGYYRLREFFRNRGLGKLFAPLVLGFVFYFAVVPIVEIFPYLFTYTSPLFGSSVSANNIIGQKSFGMGLFELKDYILSNYGQYTRKGEDVPRLGFYDTKPMKAIYPNSRVFDVRVNGPSDYDILVLTINEKMPEEIVESPEVYEKSSSLYINELEYWRIYVKKEAQEKR
jgi:4-amino-4-deoxy-L-arabinose transferase-like glycosyltransferase